MIKKDSSILNQKTKNLKHSKIAFAKIDLTKNKNIYNYYKPKNETVTYPMVRYFKNGDYSTSYRYDGVVRGAESYDIVCFLVFGRVHYES